MAESFWARRIREEMPQPVKQPVESPQGAWWQQPVLNSSRPIEELQGPAQAQPDPFMGSPASHPANRCPGCGSGNYANVNSRDPRAIHKVYRCFDCGYPVVQSTSGMGNHAGSGQKGTPARQITQMTVTSETGRVLGTTEAASGVHNNYHPQDTRAGKA
jgi:hypothetical protein